MLLAPFLLLATAATSFNRCHPRYEPAVAKLRSADAAIGRRDYRAADAVLDAGLKALGYDYAPLETADDTDLHLILAKGQRRHGKLRLAAAGKRRILAERLELCTIAPQNARHP